MNQIQTDGTTVTASTERRGVKYRLRMLLITIALLIITAFSTTGSMITPTDWRQWGMALVVNEWEFDLLSWEAEALWQKVNAAVAQPARELTHTESVSLVHTYLDRAQKMRAIETEINQLLSASSDEAERDQEVLSALQERLETLRQQQQTERGTAEQIIEAQITYELLQEGIEFAGQAFPPVQFTFVEPPRKLVVSPRDRITTIYSRMLDAEMSLELIEEREATYLDGFDRSAYITNIGGLGAFPTMVVDRASLEWILSTVAHEWVHNYLTLFPLGFNYLASADLITLNETVAEIVGNEIGARALQTFYPELVPPPPAEDESGTPQLSPTNEPPPFDFRKEMRETRIAVDQLLELGKVEDAERYMEARRLYFVENGYPLRVLNQAYFAFHGSYGTSAASTSPIGPKVEKLRALSSDVRGFLRTVRSFTSVEDLDRALAATE